MQSSGNKRFSSVEVDIDCASGGEIVSKAITANPDTVTVVDSFKSPVQEDTIRRIAVRKISSGIQFQFITLNSNPAVRSVYLRATTHGKNNQSKI
jgi:hypothetical protein